MRNLLALLITAWALGLYGQDMEALIKGEQASYETKKNHKKKRGGQQYDILYHNIKLDIDPNIRTIHGSVLSKVKTLEDNFTEVAFDLYYNMTVDSAFVNGVKVNFLTVSNEVRLPIASQSVGAEIETEIYYRGNPSTNGFFSFSYDYQRSGAIAWTLSEPYGAYGWWPCKQQLEDKIDSLDMEITVPENNKAAGLGLLQRVDTLADGSLTYYWKHRYPITTYLVAVAVTNYEEQSHYIQLSDGDSVYHLDYYYPTYREAADTLRLAIDGMMRGFDSLFGDYPFRKEKYGHAMFGRGGGMEHQTMSFMSTLDFDLMAHELAHQWFGNKITCGSWQDLWLNESWATYANAIARELIKGQESFRAFSRESRTRATLDPGGSVFAYDTTNVGNLFSGNLRYRKGSMVLHQLRWELGDSAFFAGTRNYMANADLCYGFAKTIDFQQEMEAASGEDLSPFFERYVYQQGYPELVIRWNRQNSNKIKLDISQTTSHPSVSFFPLKIKFLAKGDGRESYFTVEHSAINEEIEVNVGFKVEELVYDPNVWLIAKTTLIESDHLDLSSVLLYPNPSRESISVFIKDRKLDDIEIFDIQGRLVKKIDVNELKNYETEIDVSGLINGIYLLRASSGSESVVLKFTKAVY